MKIGAKRLYQWEDRRLNEQFDEILKRFNMWVNFPRNGLDATFSERFVKEEIITDKVINKNADIHQGKISNKERHIDSAEVGGYNAEELLQQFLVVANEDILKFNIITINGYRASSDNLNYFRRVGGMALQNINIGFSGNCQSYGLFKNENWVWEKGTNLFLGSNGQMTNIVPFSGFVLYCGKMVDTNILLLDIGQPILL